MLVMNKKRVWEVNFNGTPLTKLTINDAIVWEDHLIYTKREDGTYSVAPRKITVQGNGTSQTEKFTADGYQCSVDIELDDIGLDNRFGTLSASVDSYLGFNGTPGVSISATTISVTGYTTSPRVLCTAKLTVTDLPEEVVIPSTFNGKAVTYIAANAFKDCTQIKKLVIPDSITSYGTSPLSGCTNLETLRMPCDDATTFHFTDMFGDTYDYESVPSSLSTVIITGTTIPAFAFEGTDDIDRLFIKKIYIASSVTTIGQYAFNRCYDSTIYCEASGKQSGWHSTWNTGVAKTYYSQTLPT